MKFLDKTIIPSSRVQSSGMLRNESMKFESPYGKNKLFNDSKVLTISGEYDASKIAFRIQIKL